MAHGRASEACSSLYLCYLGIGEPLVQAQVIPYLAGLSGAGHRIVLLTFEPSALPGGERTTWRDALGLRGIEWHSVRYHKRPALAATLADVMVGIVYGAHLVRTRHLDVVHARGHVPAAMAVALKWLLRASMVFDVRGLMADEYVDAGLWKSDGMLYRLSKHMERMLLAQADAIVVLTNRAKGWLWGTQAVARRGLPVEVIPCCVDIPRFDTDPRCVRNLRTALGLDGHPVMVYAGKLGGWYMASEMVDFFQVARRHLPGLRFVVLTQSNPVLIEAEFVQRSIERDAYRCLHVSPGDLPTYLGLADLAISFRRRQFSQIAASPTKMAEYLAAGVPVVYNAGIGDLDEVVPDQAGVRVQAFDRCDYEQAAQGVRVLLEARAATAALCRGVAEKNFSLAMVGIPRYRRLYAALRRRGVDGAGVSALIDSAAPRLPAGDELRPTERGSMPAGPSR